MKVIIWLPLAGGPLLLYHIKHCRHLHTVTRQFVFFFLLINHCYNQISTSSHFRHYELKRNEDIVSFFNDFSDHLAEEALWELSLKIKPRNITRRKTDREEKT